MQKVHAEVAFFCVNLRDDLRNLREIFLADIR